MPEIALLVAIIRGASYYNPYQHADRARQRRDRVLAMMRDHGLVAGVAGHRTETIQWAADHLDLDFFMTCYYNPDDRREQSHRDHAVPEYYGSEDRDAMCALIQDLPAPAIHYKVLACGRNDPLEAMQFVAQHLRPQDAVCIGIYPKDHPDGLEEDIRLLENALSS